MPEQNLQLKFCQVGVGKWIYIAPSLATSPDEVLDHSRKPQLPFAGNAGRIGEGRSKPRFRQLSVGSCPSLSKSISYISYLSFGKAGFPQVNLLTL